MSTCWSLILHIHIAILKKLRENHKNLLVGSRCNNNNNKLELEHNFGIMGNLPVWLRDYLSVREQYTVINGVPSENRAFKIRRLPTTNYGWTSVVLRWGLSRANIER